MDEKRRYTIQQTQMDGREKDFPTTRATTLCNLHTFYTLLAWLMMPPPMQHMY